MHITCKLQNYRLTLNVLWDQLTPSLTLSGPGEQNGAKVNSPGQWAANFPIYNHSQPQPQLSPCCSIAELFSSALANVWMGMSLEFKINPSSSPQHQQPIKILASEFPGFFFPHIPPPGVPPAPPQLDRRLLWGGHKLLICNVTLAPAAGHQPWYTGTGYTLRGSGRVKKGVAVHFDHLTTCRNL